MANQTNQRKWWELCGKAGVGKKIRVGIADGTNSDATGTNYTNRLIMQLYVAQEMLDHAEAGTLLPANVISNGAGWYTANASGGEYENMGSFANGKDKGYRFRWSSFGNTTLAQLPYVMGTSDNDQIAAASGLSYYVVYDVDAADKAAANAVIASGTVGPHNRLYPAGTTVDVLQYLNPHDFTTVFANTMDAADNAFPLKYTTWQLWLLALCSIHTILIQLRTSSKPVWQPRNSCTSQSVMRCVLLQLATTWCVILTTATQHPSTTSLPMQSSALGGQLINTYDAVTNTDADDDAPEGMVVKCCSHKS